MTKRSDWRPRLLPQVLQAISDLCEKRGSTIRHIMDQMRTNIANSDIHPRPRNVIMQVRRALRHGCEVGLLRQQSRGKFKLLISDQLPKRRRLSYGKYVGNVGIVRLRGSHRNHHKYKPRRHGVIEICGSCKKGKRRRRRAKSRRRRRRRRRRRCSSSLEHEHPMDERDQKKSSTQKKDIVGDPQSNENDDAGIPMDGDNMPSSQMRSRMRFIRAHDRYTPRMRNNGRYHATTGLSDHTVVVVIPEDIQEINTNNDKDDDTDETECKPEPFDEKKENSGEASGQQITPEMDPTINQNPKPDSDTTESQTRSSNYIN